MIVPWVRIEWISDYKGYGLVATQTIHKGTITFAQDGLDIVIPEKKLKKIDPNLLEYIEKYSYEDFLGNRIVSWDLAKYMNHDDDANTLSTGYGFEIAIRDIEVGEEVTDDYRIFSTHHDTSFSLQRSTQHDIRPFPEDLIQQWDQKVLEALIEFQRVDQPLKGFIEPSILKEVAKLPKNSKQYRSVCEAFPLRYKQQCQNWLTP
jgi:hypothetical protein